MSESTTKQTIFLDTNIIQYSVNNKFGKNVSSYLAELTKRGFELAISEISYSELLANLGAKRERAGMRLLNSFTKRFAVEYLVLIGTAQLATLYSQKRKLEKKPKNEASTEDRIIASTAILSGSLVITADINDFPRPYFREVEEKLVFYKDNNKTNMIVMQILKPNIPVINQRFLERPED